MQRRISLPLFRELSGIDENIVGVGQGHKWVRGKDTGEKAVVVLVRKKHGKAELSRRHIIPKKVDGTMTDVIEVGDIRFFNERTKFRRPAQPGMSVGHYKISAGTFGAVVKDRSTGLPLILSNNHVLANLTDGVDGRAQLGDPILQPGIFDGGDCEKTVLGYLERFIPLQRELAKPQCKIASVFERTLNICIGYVKPQYRIQVLRANEKVNLVDCAVAKPTDPDAIHPEIIEVGALAGIKEPQLAMPVKKSGRSTGLTYSIIIAVDVTVKVFMTSREYGLFTDQVIAGPMSLPGDSGSLILTEDNYAVGLLFAGSEQVTIFNRIDHVLDALNIVL
ncbi:MAG: S1 family peptidase [Negativicutes bacterium]|nr:S1 family peptidase [Negativicutes bacterium]